MRTSFMENRVPPPVLMVVVAVAMWLIAEVTPHVSWPPPVRFGAAAALAAVGIGFNVAGFRTIRRAGSTIDPTRPSAASALVTGGPFRISRNPMYVGFAAMLLAWAVVLQSPWAFAGPVFFALYLNRWQIGPEERALRAKFGPDFLTYQAQVRRWL
ncbi:MAG: isoprenylcysteine carboxylmethyltransferase family protein [Chitinophagaceae bacterium]|nr:isoprenylcysteine carboxylmethyltransferase family protein [Rubrivivax sp.]